MIFRAKDDEKKRLNSAMQELARKKLSDRMIVEAIDVWKERASTSQNDYERDLSTISLAQATYSKYRKAGEVSSYEREKLLWAFFSSQQPSSDFFVSDINRFGIDRSTAEGALAFRLLDFYGSETPTSELSHLNGLAGTYSMYRKAWMSGHKNDYICTPLTITYGDGLLHVSIKQKFASSTLDIDETDKGLLLPYNSNFVSLTRSDGGIKFIAIHFNYPSLRENIPCKILSGNLMSISGDGPHPSFKFYCKRDADAKNLIIKDKDMREGNKFLDVIDYLD